MKLAIIGAGISGLTTGLCLQKLGIEWEIYERSPVLEPVGAGILMAPNAMQVFHWLGISDKIKAAGMPLDRVALGNSKLESFSRTTTGVMRKDDSWDTVAIHRGKLQEVLLSMLPSERIYLDHPFHSLNQTSDSVQVEFEGKGTKSFDYVLGADGLKSKVREAFNGNSSLRYAGQSCWRGILDWDLPQEHSTSCFEAWGDRVRFGFSAVSAGKVYWFAVSKEPAGGVDDPALIKDQLITKFKSFDPVITEILDHTPVQNIFRSDIYDLQRLKSWSDRRVCLIGDAAHATTPNMGQGGCQGVEDAYYISKALAGADDFSTAFKQFESSRRTKVDYVVNSSWRIGKMAHSSWGPLFMKSMMAMMPKSALEKQMAKLYEMDMSF